MASEIPPSRGGTTDWCEVLPRLRAASSVDSGILDGSPRAGPTCRVQPPACLRRWRHPPLEPSARLTQRLSKPWPRRQPQRGRPAFRTECGWRFSQVPPRCESSCRETLAATGLVILFKPDLGKRRLLHGRAFPIRTVLLFGTLRAKKKSDLPRIERLSPCRPSDG